MASINLPHTAAVLTSGRRAILTTHLSFAPSFSSSSNMYAVTKETDLFPVLSSDLGLLILGVVVERAEAVCNVACVRKGHITCRNYPGQQIPGCSCMCSPPDGRRCVVHIPNGMAKRCWRNP